MRKRLLFVLLALLIGVAPAYGSSSKKGAGGGGGVDILGDLSPTLCTSGKILYRATTEWECLDVPSGGSFTFTMSSDSGSQAIVNLDTFDIEGGAGVTTTIVGLKNTITLNSDAIDFLTSGDLSSACGLGEQGKIGVHTGALEYCNNAATPTHHYAAYGDADGIVAANMFDNAAHLNAAGEVDNASHTHTVANLSNTTATNTQLNNVTDGSNADTEHVHTDTGHPVGNDHINAVTEIDDPIKTAAHELIVMALEQGGDGKCVEWSDADGLVAAADACGSSEGGATIIVKEDNGLLDADIDTLDFLSADFGLSEAPENELQLIINANITRDLEVPDNSGDIEGNTKQGLTIIADRVGLDELGACDGDVDEIVKYDSDGVPTCEIAIATDLSETIVRYEVLVVDNSGNWVDGAVNLAQSDAVTGILAVGNGGTGNASSLTDGGVLLGSGTSAFSVVARQNSGQLLVGSDSGDPAAVSLDDGDGLLAVEGDGTLSIEIDLNTTKDVTGADGSGSEGFSGMEITATGELSLLNGCADTEGLFWTIATGKWECGAPTTAEGNDLETAMDDVADHQIAVGDTGGGVAIYDTVPDCDAVGSALSYDEAGHDFKCRSGFGAGGVVTGLIGETNENASTLAEVSVDGIAEGAGAGIGTVSDGANPFVISFLPANVDNITWSDGGEATIAHVFSLSGSDDPTVTYGNGLVAISGTTIDFTTTGHIVATGGSLVGGTSGAPGTVVLYDDAGGENLTIAAASATTTYTLTLPAAVPGGDYVPIVDTSGDMTWLDIATDYAATTGDLSQFAADETTSAEMRVLISDEHGTGNAVFHNTPTITNTVLSGTTKINTAGVTIAGSVGTMTIAGNGTGYDESLKFDFDTVDGTVVVTSPSNAVYLDFMDNSIGTEDLFDEVRSMVWNAGAMSADGTECEDPAELVLNSGPKQFGIVCPMTTADTDGYLYGSTVLPDGFQAAGDFLFMGSAVLSTDSGDGTFHGSIGIQCVSAGDVVDNSWGTEADVDFLSSTNDQWDIITASDDVAVDAAGCAGEDTMWWRWSACDEDNEENANCQQTTIAVDDITILSMRMEYTTNIGD